MAYAKSELGFKNVDYSYQTADFDWKSLDIDTINHINETITSIQSKYPELKGAVENFQMIAPAKMRANPGRYAQISLNPRTGQMNFEFGMPLTKGLDHVKSEYQNDLSLNHHPPGTGHDSLIWHEYGHVYAEKALRGLRLDTNQRITARKEGTLEKVWAKKASDARGQSVEELSAGISKYAQQNPREAFAEAFAECNCSQSPRAESIELMKQSGAAR